MSNTLRVFLSKWIFAFLMFLPLAGALRSQPGDRAEFNQTLSEAGKLFDAGDFAAVIQRLSPWVNQYPNDAELNHGLGLAYYQQQDFAATIRHLSSALQHEEKDSGAWRQSTEILGMAYYFSNRWPDAARLLAAASAWSPTNSTLSYSLAMSYLYSHDREHARETISRLFGVGPNTADAAMLTADLAYQEMAGDDAEALYLEVLKKRPDFPRIHYKLGLIAITNRNYDAAIEHMKAELAQNVSDSLAWHYLGEALAKLEKHDDAVEALQRAIWLNSTSVRSYVALGQVYSDQGKFAIAESSLKRALAIEPQNYQANYLLGRLYSKTNRPELARQQMALTEKLRKPAAEPK
jgi:tetratricopeptide (TPR) repeat protein